MRAALLSVAAGLLVGVIYGMLKVKSPAPPVVALFGLFGMLAGEQLVQQARNWRDPQAMRDAASTAVTGAPAPPAKAEE